MYKKHNKLLLLLIIGVSPFFLFGCDNNGKAQGMQIPFADARIIFEVNSTDGDAGIQIFLDGEPWNEVKIFSPNEEQIFEALGRGNLEGFGLSELFAESNEPPFEEMPLQEVLDLFPEGDYEFKGTTVDGDELVGTATLTHDIPCGPEIVSPPEGAVLDPTMPVVIQWETVTSQLDPATAECDESEIEIFGYQVIVDTFQVTLPASATSVTVPPQFIEANTPYSFEVLAIEDRGTDEGGNQTITSSFFCTAPLTPCPAP